MAQRACAIAVLGDLENSAGHRPEPLDWALSFVPLSAVGLCELLTSLPIQPVLL